MKKKSASKSAFFNRRVLIGLSITALALCGSHAALLATCTLQTTWSDHVGSWFTAGNWSNGEPDSHTAAQINNGGDAQINSAILTANACSLMLGLNSGDSGTVSVDTGSGGTLNVAQDIVVGSNGTGVLDLGTTGTVTGGSIAVGGSGTLAFNVIPSSTGTITVSGTATLSSGCSAPCSTVKVTMTGTFTPGTKYTLLTATSGLTGTFGTESFSYPSGQGWTPQITYDSKHFYLYLKPNT